MIIRKFYLIGNPAAFWNNFFLCLELFKNNINGIYYFFWIIFFGGVID